MSPTTTDRNYASLRSLSMELDTSPEGFGQLRSSADAVDDTETLRARMSEDGYLFLPGYLDRELVLASRRSIADMLAAEGYFDPDSSPQDMVPGPEAKGLLRPDIAKASGPLQELLYSGRMIQLYERFLGGEIRPYDYTWLRAVPPGTGTPPHGDSVFMGRGTLELYTAWTPLGDIPISMGGVMLLENSHRVERIKNNYGMRDVDSYCTNRDDADEYASGEKWWGGWLSKDPVTLRERVGGRWLTADYRAGDLLTFGMFTLHGSLDNGSSVIRLSCDSRYQLASEPIDERWIGDDPPAHGPGGKRGRIC